MRYTTFYRAIDIRVNVFIFNFFSFFNKGATKPEMSLNPQFALKVINGTEEAETATSNSFGSNRGGNIQKISQALRPDAKQSSRSSEEAIGLYLIEISLVFPGSGKPKPSVFLAADTAEKRNAWVKAINDGKKNVPRGPRTAV